MEIIRVQLVDPEGGIRHLHLTLPRSAARKFPRVVMARTEEEAEQ